MHALKQQVLVARRLAKVVGSAENFRRVRPLCLAPLLCFCLMAGLWGGAAQAYEFALSGINFDLQEVSSNLDVYFSAMRWNRLSNEWDVDVTISNKSAGSFSAPLILLVDGFNGTSGVLRPDGLSTNKAYFDFTGQLPSGVLGPAQVSIPRTWGIGFVPGQAPQIVSRLFAGVLTNAVPALGFVRSLNEVGQPLAAVSLTESGPAGTVTNATDAVFGVATVGQAPGSYRWQFSQNGYLPVWRQATLQSNSVSVIPYPRLTARNPQTFNLSPLLGGTASNQSVVIQFAAGSVGPGTVAQLTGLSGQTLPFFLPQGWSPVQAFWIELNLEPSQPAVASLVPWGPITNSEMATLVRLVPATMSWQVLQSVPGNGTNALSLLLPGSGAYALVVPDSTPASPPAAVAGSSLHPSVTSVVNPASLRAAGTVTPATSPANLAPELVTGSADLVVSNLSGALASGTLLRGEVSEHELLNDGTSRVPPLFDEFLVGYQRPGQPQTGVLHAQFPLRPVLLFGPEQLDQGVVHMDLFAPGAFAGGVLNTNGGIVASDGIRLLAAQGAVNSEQAVELRGLSATNFASLAGTNSAIVAAFEVAMGALPPGKELFLQTTGVPPNLTFVLARVLTQQGLYGLEPHARLHSDGVGNLFSDEPGTGDRLPGLNGAGQYVLIEVQPQQALVEGTAKNASGQPAGGLAVTITGQPWLTFSAADGSYKLLAPAGSGNLALSNPATGDSGGQAINVPGNLSPVIASVALSLNGLQVASITPADTATNVPQVSSVVVAFNRPVNPSTVLSNAVQLMGASNQPVAATFSLNLANTIATLLPNAPLDPATQFTVLLSTNIADALGRSLQGQTQFSFRTVALTARDPAAQLIIYEPGATNLDTNIVASLPGYVPGTNASLVVVHGTPGCSDPGVPVIIVNEGTGESTTVLSKSDGSFTSFVRGQEQDFISATFVSLNSARVYVPVNRQLFDDGSVGLYQQGGTLQATGDGGPVQITVPPNAVAARTKFKLQSVNTNELSTQLAGVMPTNGLVAGSALNLHIEGNAPSLPVQVSFPVDLGTLGYPTNEPPTNAAAAVALVRTTQDVTTFEIMDQLHFVPQSSGPLIRNLSSSGGKSRRKGDGVNPGTLAGALDTSTGVLVSSLGSPGLLAQVGFNQVIVPLMFGPRPVTIKGKVVALPIEVSQQLQLAGLGAALFNFQVGGALGNQQMNVPIQLAQLLFPQGANGLTAGGALIGSSTLSGAGAVIGAVVPLALEALKLAEMHLETPLSGAFITVSLANGGLVSNGGAVLVNVPGHLFPGMVYCTSDASGSFLTVAPAAGANYIATCTHPLYQETQSVPIAPITIIPGQQGQLSLAGAVFETFTFQAAVTNAIGPSVQIGADPVQPGPGQPCQIVVNASQATGTPTIAVKVTLGRTNLLTGRLDTNATYSLANVVQSTPSRTSTEWTGTLTVSDPVEATLTILVSNPSGPNGVLTSASIPYHIQFSGPVPPPAVGNIPPPGTNDMHGPVVMETDPPDNGFIGENGQISIVFNKPIDPQVTNNLAGISLSSVGSSQPVPISPIVLLNPNQQVLILQYPGLPPATTYQLTLTGRSIQDLAAQPLNQLPSSKTPVSFTTTFRTTTNAIVSLPQLVNGRGTVISGTQLYALDQGPQGNYLDSYDISYPLQPRLESRVHLFGAPRDLVVVPQYRYQLNAQNHTIFTNDIVAVVGGDLGTLDTSFGASQGPAVSVPGQYLTVLNMGDPSTPQTLASPIVSYRVGGAVTKVRWAPPYLVYEEYGPDAQLLAFVNLQELIIGYNSSLGQQQAYANSHGKPGVDSNGDGDYVDPGETLPVPGVNGGGYFGNDFSYLIQGTTQPTLDFSATAGGITVGITLRNGVGIDATNGTPTGPAYPPMYRTLVSHGLQLNIASPTDAAYPFPGAYPRWVSVFDALQVETNGVPFTISAALVSLEPDTNGVQTLAVLDISLPEQPRLLNKIPLPTSLLGGDIESVSRRSDGLIEVNGSQNVAVLEPRLLAVTNVPAGQLHPAIVDVIQGAGGTTRSLGTSFFGVHSVADSGRASVVQSPPPMEFVSFPNNPGLVDPAKLYLQSDATLQQLFSGINPLSGLAPANINTNLGLSSDLEPTKGLPNAALHYYVLVYAPGGHPADSQLDLGLESLNPSGRPLSNLGVGFAPVRAVSTNAQQAIGQTLRPCGAPIRPLPAWRVSNNPYSVYYNWYLSRPFALVTDGVSLDDLARMQVDAGVEREILFSAYWLRAFIDPDQSSSPTVGPFAAQPDILRQVLYPTAAAVARTVNRDYVVGHNPPPPGAATPMEDSYGTVMSHSGELRLEDPDMVLLSPRMPIEIIRAIGNQDTYEGPFGVGWDFNYNQRLTILDPLTFPEGLQMPLVVRDTQGDSDIAGSQDILFNTGEGMMYHFVWQGTNMPTEFSSDPLVQQFNYQTLVSDYYLPEHGLFDLLVKFKDGRFERLTPSGARYDYRSDGRLEMILDRYPNNRQDLTYDPNNKDLLIRIDDHSVLGPRYVLFGYYRHQNSDRSFTAGLDMDTSDAWLVGKICRIQDYAGRDVLYQYNPEGFLIARLGVVVNGENGGYSGRSHTFYSYTGCRLTQVSLMANGTPLISVVNALNGNGEPVATSSTGAKGTDTYSIPLNNSAATVGKETTGVALGDGSTIQRQFDQWGGLAAVTVSGTNGPPATAVFSNTADGLEWFVKYPEGNSQTLGYDTNNPIFRSRGNLVSIKVDPGPRGGQGYTLTLHYDPHYNLLSGDQVDANGFRRTYALTGDGRDVEAITFGNAGSESFTYNANGQLTGTVDPNGFQHTLSYDSTTGFLITEKRGDITFNYTYDGSIPSQLGKPASLVPALGAPTTFKNNNLLETVEMDRGASVKLTAYDELGRPFWHQDQVGGGKQWTSQLTYDNKGFITSSVMNGLEVNGSVSSISYTYIPDARSRLQSIVLPSGGIQAFAYDNRGNVSQMTLGNYTEQYAHDLNNNLTSIIQGGDVVQNLQYDGLDRVTNLLAFTGAQTYSIASGYYPGGQLASYTVTDPQFGVVKQQTGDQIDALGRTLQATVHGGVISPQYQYAFNPLSVTVTGPRVTATRTFDAAGDQIGYSDPDSTVTLKRDANGRVYEADRQEDGAVYSAFYGYSDLDWETNYADLAGTIFSAVPRADGNDLSITDARGNTTTYDYSALGETLDRRRPDGMEVRARYNAQRQLVYQGDPGAGFNYGFDPDLRLTNSTLRSGAVVAYSGFDPRNLPTTLALPGGGGQTVKYDLQRRVLQRKVNYQATTWEEDYTYDALGRVRAETYIQNGGPNNTAGFDIDPAGPLLAEHYHQDNADFTIGYGYYADGTRKSITYPSGVIVTEVRDSTGRLTGLSDGKGNIIQALSWQGNHQPKAIQLGSTMLVTNTYDPRGRLTGGLVSRASDGAVLAHLRYQYDAANNVDVRQFVHRNGKADNLGYDVAERLSRAQVGAVPLANNAFATPLYDVSYNYNAGGLDYLTTAALATNLTPDLPAFATNWTAHDNFLLPAFVDGFNRGQADPMGNVAQAMLWVRSAGSIDPAPVAATLQHDGLGRLVSITRADGVTIDNEYRPGGLRIARKVSQGGQVLSSSSYVYDSSARLLEEYDHTGANPVLIARYYYASSDAPAAADLLQPASGQLERYYFLRDASQSVIAVADTNGVVVERAWYDPFGQPVLEQRDTAGPKLMSVLDGGTNSLLIAFSEPVWAPTNDPGPGGGIVPFPPLPTNAVTVSVLSSNIPGTIQWLPSLPGFAPYSVVRFTPNSPLPGVPPAGFVAWWPASGSGQDVQGNHNAILQGGASFGPGLVDEAFLLNGTSAFVQVPDSPALNFGTNDFTASLWVNFKSTSGQQVLIEKWATAPLSGWSLIKMANNQLRLALSNGAGGEIDVDSGSLAIPLTNWVHYAVRRQNNQFTIFTNGVQVASGSASPNLSAATSLKFGTRGGTSFFLNGGIDEVTLYSRALSTAEITAVAGGVEDPGPVNVTVNPGTLVDDWGNTNAAETASFQVYSQSGLVYYAAEPLPQTGALPLARSSVGSPFLFQGQYFDYDAGLVYLRARFYDPYSGMFLEPDPMGYEDSVNHYAGFANNPTTARDPTGLKREKANSGEWAYKAIEESRSREEPGSHLFTDEVVRVSREHHQELVKVVAGDSFVPAIVGAAARMLPENGSGTLRFTFKGVNSADRARVFVRQGIPTKVMAVAKKTVKGLVQDLGRIFTGDVDGLTLQRGKEFATAEDVDRFENAANEGAKLLGKIEIERRSQIEGAKVYAEEPSYPFNHGFQGHVQEELAHYSPQLAESTYHAIQHKVKNMPDGWSITLEGNQQNFTLKLEKLGQQDVAQLFSDIGQDFNERLNPNNTARYDETLFGLIVKQLYQGGDGEYLKGVPHGDPNY